MTVLKVKDVMSPDVETLVLGEPLDLANMVISLGRIRHLPVVDGEGRLCGLVTHRDVLSSFAELFRRKGTEDDAALIRVETIMTRDLITIGPDQPALEAAHILYENKFGCVPVVEADDKLVGIVTEADFVLSAIRQLSDPSV